MSKPLPRYQIWARQWQRLTEFALLAEKYGWHVETFPGKFGSEVLKATSAEITITVVAIPKRLNDEAEPPTRPSDRMPRATYNIEHPTLPKRRITAGIAHRIIRS